MILESPRYTWVPDDEKVAGSDQATIADELDRLKGPLCALDDLEKPRLAHSLLICSFSAVLILLVASAMVMFMSVVHQQVKDDSLLAQDTCKSAPTRREWRTLLEDEKLDYIRAVRCMATVASVVKDEGTVWDDFAWVHEKIGIRCEPSLTVPPRFLNLDLIDR